jgi:hypothetical protein
MLLSDEIANFSWNYRALFLRGIPHLLNDDGAYLSFGCTFSGVEVLAGYSYPDESSNGVRFKNWIAAYFPVAYHAIAKELWDLRNSLIHGFSPKHFALCHGRPSAHLTDQPPYKKVLNAESLFDDFQASAERYLCQVVTDSNLLAAFEKHLKAAKGGGLYVG